MRFCLSRCYNAPLVIVSIGVDQCDFHAVEDSDGTFLESKGLSVNKTFALASGFWRALAAPQSQNPRRSQTTPVVLLNLRDQISLKIRRNP
jgi:hypothetical protein